MPAPAGPDGSSNQLRLSGADEMDIAINRFAAVQTTAHAELSDTTATPGPPADRATTLRPPGDEGSAFGHHGGAFSPPTAQAGRAHRGRPRSPIAPGSGLSSRARRSRGGGSPPPPPRSPGSVEWGHHGGGMAHQRASTPERARNACAGWRRWADGLATSSNVTQTGALPPKTAEDETSCPEAAEVWLFVPDFRKFGRQLVNIWMMAHLESRVSATPVRFGGVRSLKHACLHAVLKQNVGRENLLTAIRDQAQAARAVPGPTDSAYGMPRWIEGRLEAPRVIRVVPRPITGPMLPRGPRPPPQGTARLSPRTAVRVVYGAYRIVLCVELSPSLLRPEGPRSTRPSADLLFHAVDTALRSALLPITEGYYRDAPAGTPVIHLSVIARGLADAPLQPLLMRRRMTLTLESYTTVMTAVSISLRNAVSQLIVQQQKRQFTHASTLAESLHDVQFVMDQLPEEACPIVLLVTDGTVAAPDLTRYDNVVMDMNARDISISIICVHNPSGRTPIGRYPFGVVPDFEALRFLCTMTGGTFTYPGEQGFGLEGQPPLQQQQDGEEFLLSSPEQLARRVKTGRIERLPLPAELGAHQTKDRGRAAAEEWMRGWVVPVRLRYSIFVRCYSVDGDRWRRMGCPAPAPRVSGLGRTRSSPRGSHSLRQYRDRLGFSTVNPMNLRSVGFDASTDWHWHAVKEVRTGVDTVASILLVRLNEGFTICHCELELGPPDGSGRAKWEFALQMHSVWQPLRTGIEWSLLASGQLAHTEEWAAQSQSVQRLLLLNRLLHPLWEEPGWISELEVPFEAGITRVDGRPMSAEVQSASVDVMIGFRLWPTEASRQQSSGSTRVPSNVARFMTQMTFGIDARIQAICRQVLHAGAWERSQQSETYKLTLIQTVNDMAGLGAFAGKWDEVASRRIFGAVENLNFWIRPKAGSQHTSAEIAEMVQMLDEVFSEACAHWCRTESFSRRKVALDEFNKRDSDGDGFLSFIEAKACFAKIHQITGVEVNADELAAAALASVTPHGKSGDAVSLKEFLECWRIKNRRTNLRLLSAEDWGELSFWDDTNAELMHGESGYYPSSPRMSAASAGNVARLPSFCCVNYRWMPGTHTFAMSLRFFRVPLHGTRVKLVHGLIGAVLQRTSALPFNFEVVIAPKALRNVLLGSRQLYAGMDPRFPPNRTSLETTRDVPSHKPSTEAALQSYLCKVTWKWKLWRYDWAWEDDSQGGRAGIFVEKYVAALKTQWKRHGFIENLLAPKLLVKEFVCRNDPLEMHSNRQSRVNIAEAYNAIWEQWQYWHIKGNVRSLVQYSVSAAPNGTVQVEAWVEPTCVHRDYLDLATFYRMPDHALSRHREPQVAAFYNFQEPGRGSQLSTGAAEALVEQLYETDEACISELLTFDRLVDMCERHNLRQPSAERSGLRFSVLCSVCRADGEGSLACTPTGRHLCSACAQTWLPEVQQNVKQEADAVPKPWTQETMLANTPFKLSLILGNSRRTVCSFPSPSEGTWSLPVPSVQRGKPPHISFNRQMLRALAAVFDLELWLSQQEVVWLRTRALDDDTAQDAVSHSGVQTAPRCFVKRVGTHRLLIAVVFCSSKGVLLHLYHCSQPTIPFQAEHVTWDQKGTCFGRHCRFCQKEGYEGSTRFGSMSDLSVPLSARASPNPMKMPPDATPTPEVETETKSTWFLEMLDFVYHRVYVTVLTQELDGHAAVRPEDLRTAREHQLSFGTDLTIARMKTSAVPIDMSRVHRVLSQRQQDSLASFYDTPAVGLSTASARRHTYKLPRASASDPEVGNPLPRADSAPNKSVSLPVQRLASHDFSDEIDRRREPKLWQYYRSDMDKDSDLSDMEGAILQTLAAQKLLPLGPADYGLFFCSTARAPSVLPMDESLKADLESYTDYIPGDQARFVDPCLSGAVMAEAKGQYETNMSAWLRAFAMDRNTQKVAQSPMLVKLVVEDLPRTAETQARCVLSVRAHVLLPIRLDEQISLHDEHLSDSGDGLRIKHSLPEQQRDALRALLKTARATAAEVLLHHMPVRDIKHPSTVSLITQAMDDVRCTPDSQVGRRTDVGLQWAAGQMRKTAGLFSFREFRLHFENESDQTETVLLEELRNTNLLNLAETQGGVFVVVESPQLQVSLGGRVEEPLTNVKGDGSEFAAVAPPFWCFLDTKRGRSTVCVRLFTSKLTYTEHHDFLRAIDAALATLSKRANVNYLLKLLHESRVCDPMLFDPTAESVELFHKERSSHRAPANSRWQVESVQAQSPRNDSSSSSSSKSKLSRDARRGIYRLPLLHTIVLPVKGRVRATEAIAELWKALQPFEIENRDHAFVYADMAKNCEGNIFYSYLWLMQNETGSRAWEELPSFAEAAADSAVLTTRSRSMSAPPKLLKPPVRNSVRSSAAQRDQPHSEDMRGRAVSICIHLYGIFTPSAQLITELQQWMQSRLEALELSTLSLLLRYDPDFEVTQIDSSYMCDSADSSLRPPSSSATLVLPSAVTKPGIFLSMLCENLVSTRLVHLMKFANDGSSTTASHDSLQEIEEGNLFRCPGDSNTQLRMFYNYQQDRGSAEDVLGRKCGDGVAFIAISIVPDSSPDGAEHRHLDVSDPQPLWPQSDRASAPADTPRSPPMVRLQRASASISGHQSQAGSAPKPTKLKQTKGFSSDPGITAQRLVVELWAKGAVNAEELMNCAELNINRALHEYCLDIVCLQSLRLVRGMQLKHVGTAFGNALKHGALMVRYFSVEFHTDQLAWNCTLPPWCCEAYISEALKICQDFGLDVTVCVEQENGDGFSPGFTDQLKSKPPRNTTTTFARGGAGDRLSTAILGKSSPPPHADTGAQHLAGAEPAREMARENSVCLVVIHKGRVWCHTYNWEDSRVLILQTALVRLLRWVCNRSMLLCKSVLSNLQHVDFEPATQDLRELTRRAMEPAPSSHIAELGQLLGTTSDDQDQPFEFMSSLDITPRIALTLPTPSRRPSKKSSRHRRKAPILPDGTLADEELTQIDWIQGDTYGKNVLAELLLPSSERWVNEKALAAFETALDQTLGEQPSGDDEISRMLAQARDSTDDLLLAHVRGLQAEALSAQQDERCKLHQASLLKKLRSDTHASRLHGRREQPTSPPSEPMSTSLPAEQQPRPLLSGRPIDPVQLEFNLRCAARLLHTCRWPLLFNDARTLLQADSWFGSGTYGVESVSVNSEHTVLTETEAEALAQYRRQLESVLHYYTQYLRTVLDFHLVCIVPGEPVTDLDQRPDRDQHQDPEEQEEQDLENVAEEGSPSGREHGGAAERHPRASITVGQRRLVLCDSPRVYLCKAVAGSEDVTGDGRSDAVMVLKLQFDGIFVCADLYSPEEWPPEHRPARRGVRSSKSTLNSTGQMIRLGSASGMRGAQANLGWLHAVDDAAIKVQQNLHFQSFLYDFHLHHACLGMLRPPNEPPTFAVVGLLRILSQHHTATAVGSDRWGTAGGEPRGAVGALRHQPEETVELPYPVARESLHEFLSFLVERSSRFGCRTMRHPDDRDSFCVLSSRPPSEWRLDEESADCDEDIACVGMGAGAHGSTSGQLYFCVVHIDLHGDSGTATTMAAETALDSAQGGLKDDEARPAAGSVSERAQQDSKSLQVELFVGRGGTMEGYCPKIRFGQAIKKSRTVARLPPAAAARYVRQIFRVVSHQFERRRLWQLLLRRQLDHATTDDADAVNGPTKDPTRTDDGSTGAGSCAGGGSGGAFAAAGDDVPPGVGLQISELLHMCYHRRVYRFDRRLRWLCSAPNRRMPAAEERGTETASSVDMTVAVGGGAPDSSPDWASFLRFLASEKCRYTLALVCLPNRGFPGGGATAFGHARGGDLDNSPPGSPSADSPATTGQLRWECIMCDAQSHDVAIQMRFFSAAAPASARFGNAMRALTGACGASAISMLDDLISAVGTDALQLEDTWVIGIGPVDDTSATAERPDAGSDRGSYHHNRSACSENGREGDGAATTCAVRGRHALERWVDRLSDFLLWQLFSGQANRPTGARLPEPLAQPSRPPLDASSRIAAGSATDTGTNESIDARSGHGSVEQQQQQQQQQEEEEEEEEEEKAVVHSDRSVQHTSVTDAQPVPGGGGHSNHRVAESPSAKSEVPTPRYRSL